MKTLFMLFCFNLIFASNIFGQRIEDELFDLLKREKYHTLVNKVCTIRERAYFKNAFMDYCLAYGYCKLKQPALAGEWFDHMLASYNNLSTSKRNELRELKQSCTGTRTTGGSTKKLFEFLSSMSVEGFQGNSTGIESKMGTPSLTDTVKEFDFEHLTFDTQNRKFTLQQKQEALVYYKNLIGDKNLKADTTAHFLIFYPSNALSIKSHIRQLEEYYEYYNKMFNLEKSDRLITIFYSTNRSDFTEVAERIHKIPVPRSTFGYASSVDLVMMGIANAAWLGAMKHELFHLMIRSFVGDIPPWLDEGTASFFESSTLHGSTATTNFSWSNYRFNLLRHIDDVKSEIRYSQNKEMAFPSLQQLIDYNWQEFSGKTGDLMINASYNQSLSYAFITYLNEKNLLNKMIAAFRNRAYSETSTDAEGNSLILMHLRTNEELINNVTGMNLKEIQAAFTEWCQRKNINLE